MLSSSTQCVGWTNIHAVTSIAYILTLLLCVIGPIPSYQIAVMGAWPIFPLSMAVAVLTFPVTVLVVRNGYGIFGSMACGALGAFAGRGALALATLSAALGLDHPVLPITFLGMEILVLLSLFFRDRMGRMAVVIEILSAAVVALMTIAPMACFMILNPL